jgi:FtsZ-interacting cell division protein ZipA
LGNVSITTLTAPVETHMAGLLVPLGIIVVMSILGYLMQMLKNASNKQEQQRLVEAERRRRAAKAVRNEQSELDRYLRAVQQQSQKKPAPAPVQAKVVTPVVKPVRPAIADEPAREAFKTTKPAPPPRNQPTAPSEAKQPKQAKQAKLAKGMAPAAEPPAARIISPALLASTTRSEAPARPAKIVSQPAPGRSDEAVTEFVSELQGLLKGKNALAMAVVLQEILGKPKAMRG